MSESRPVGNSFGIIETAFGFVAGILLAALAISFYQSVSPHRGTAIGMDIVDFGGLWAGFVGAVIIATRLHRPGTPVPVVPPTSKAAKSVSTSVKRPPEASGTGSVFRDYGVKLRPWPDIPLGIVVGIVAQYGLVPVLEYPLEPFVSNFHQQIDKPATSLLQPVNGVSLVVLTILVCVGSPLVEELFFRGLLLRGLLGRTANFGQRRGPAVAIVITGLIFGLAHFEPLQFLGLAGFGMVLAYVAYRTGRLGPAMVAHVAFNLSAVVIYLLGH